MPEQQYYPSPTSPQVSAVMRGNRRTDTRPERLLRSLLHRRGLRFRKDMRIDVGTRNPRPDIVFPRINLAVFVDGCFWHKCPAHGRVPGGANADYWRHKLERNVTRDRLDTDALEAHGWRVLRIWEHQDITEAVEKIIDAVRSS